MSEPSALLLDHEAGIRAAARLGPCLDIACGRGRHALAVARWGVPVVALDRDADSLGELAGAARAEALPVHPARADLEAAPHLPVAEACFGSVLVFRYLHRPLAPELARALRPGGLLLYETFTIHQRDLGYGPGNPDFLLHPSELPSLFPTLQILRHWEGETTHPKPFAVAHLTARRPA